MQNNHWLKNFIHVILTVLYCLLLLWILIAKVNFAWGVVALVSFLLLWKIIYGLANINFFILLSIFINSFVLALNFKLTSTLIFLVFMLFLFYFRVLDIKKEVKNNLPIFLVLKQLFFYMVFFANILTLYCLFYLNHWPFTLVFVLFALLSYISFSWYKKLNNINWILYEKIVIFVVFMEMSWFLFNFSNGFFVFPMLTVFWFYNLVEIYRNILNWNWKKMIDFVILPIVLTAVVSFLIKL
jgi:hypothetical protein